MIAPSQRSTTARGPAARVSAASTTPGRSPGPPTAKGTRTSASPVCSVATGTTTTTTPSPHSARAAPGRSTSSSPASAQTSASGGSEAPGARPARRCVRRRAFASSSVSDTAVPAVEPLSSPTEIPLTGGVAAPPYAGRRLAVNLSRVRHAGARVRRPAHGSPRATCASRRRTACARGSGPPGTSPLAGQVLDARLAGRLDDLLAPAREDRQHLGGQRSRRSAAPLLTGPHSSPRRSRTSARRCAWNITRSGPPECPAAANSVASRRNIRVPARR